MIKLENLTKRYPISVTKYNTAVKELSLHVKKGEVFGFLGPNGSGKTTTIKAILGLINPTDGRVLLMDKDPSIYTSRNNVGYLPENPYFYSHLTGKELLEFAAGLHGMNKKDTTKRIKLLLDMVSMTGKEDMFLKGYSKGMLQRIGVAQALINDPDLILLDEPMSGLDPIGRYEIKNVILDLKKQGKTIFFCSHILSDVEDICTNVAIIVDGHKIVEGKIGEINKGKKTLEEYFIEVVKKERS